VPILPLKTGTIPILPLKKGTIPILPLKTGTVSVLPLKTGAVPVLPLKTGVDIVSGGINPLKPLILGGNSVIKKNKGDDVKVQTPKILPFEDYDLPGLSVIVQRNINMMALNDDTYAPLTCTWYKNLIRIATIGDGSCFIHAFLKAFAREYQENGSAKFRMELVAKVRLFLALSLKAENPEYPGYTYWETSGRGAFPAQLMSEIKSEYEITEEKSPGPTLLEEIKLDYSVTGMQYLFNSSAWLGDEVYNIIADIFNLDVYILRAKRGDLTPHAKTRKTASHKNAIVIVGNTQHYEVVGVEKDDGFQTVFAVDDDFIKAINNLPSPEGNIFGLVNTSIFSPDEEFISNFVNHFVTPDKGLVIPELVNNISPDKTDPFISRLNILMPRIEIAANRRIKYLRIPSHPILTKLNSLTSILLESGWTPEKIKYIKEIVADKIIFDIQQTLNDILISLKDEELVSEEDFNTIITAEEILI